MKEKTKTEKLILKFLKKKEEENGFSIRKISQGINKPYPDVYYTIRIMEKRGEIKIKDYGNIKLVFLP